MNILNRSLQRAFTIIELLVVIGIIGLLSGLLIPVVTNSMTKATVADARVKLTQIAQAVEAFKGEYGYYPTGLTGDADGIVVLTVAATGASNANGNNLYDCLSGADNAGGPLLVWGNRKDITFYTFDGASITTPITGNGSLIIAIDKEGDGELDLGAGLNYDPDGDGTRNMIYATVILFSLGPSGWNDRTTVTTW